MDTLFACRVINLIVLWILRLLFCGVFFRLKFCFCEWTTFYEIHKNINPVFFCSDVKLRLHLSRTFWQIFLLLNNLQATFSCSLWSGSVAFDLSGFCDNCFQRVYLTFIYYSYILDNCYLMICNFVLVTLLRETVWCFLICPWKLVTMELQDVITRWDRVVWFKPRGKPEFSSTFKFCNSVTLLTIIHVF